MDVPVSLRSVSSCAEKHHRFSSILNCLLSQSFSSTAILVTLHTLGTNPSIVFASPIFGNHLLWKVSFNAVEI